MGEPNMAAVEASAPSAPARNSIFGRLIEALNALGSVLILAMMVLICADVLSRDLLNQPIHGVGELVALSIIAIVFLQLASTLRHGRMARAEIFLDELKARHPRRGALLQAALDGCGVAACAIIIYASWPIFTAAWTNSEFIGVPGMFTVPLWPVKLIILIGGLLTALQYAAHGWASLRAAIQGPAAHDAEARP